MRLTLLLVMLLSVVTLSAQENNLNVTQNSSSSLLKVGNAIQSSYGSATIFHNPVKEAEGSLYLFDDWKNRGVIYAINKQKFGINNINLNVQKNTLEAKISNDSIFTFNFNNIEKFIINEKVFKNIYTSNGKKIYEMIYESKDFSILKGYKIQIVKGSTNPMVNRKNDKYVQRHTYYSYKNNTVHPFKLSKKRVLEIVNNKERAKSVDKFMNDNKLSYKNEKDVAKALRANSVSGGEL